MTAATAAKTTTDPPPVLRYVPPPLRDKRRETRHVDNGTNAADLLPRTSDLDSRQTTRGGGVRRPPVQPSVVVVADRWKDLDDGSEATTAAGCGGAGSSSSYRRHEKSGDTSASAGRYTSKRSSATGTGWDVRDGRSSWRPENAADVFGTTERERSATASSGINFDSYDAIPVEVSGAGSETLQPLVSFKETVSGIHPLLQANVRRVGYERPTPVQKYAIPAILNGRDLMACAQTGSGKTAAFLFPIITTMLHQGPPRPITCRQHGSKPTAYPVTLVLSPTRELAVQIFNEARKFAFGTGIKTVVVYGGSEVRAQFQTLRSGCDICVATPGRLTELTTRGAVGLEMVMFFVLDEADRMLDMGFAPQIYSIVDDYRMPTPKQGRQTVMFSATFPTPIQKLAAEFLKDYMFLSVGRVGSTNECITQQFIYANETSKPKRLLHVLEENKGGLILVFVETKKKADLIEMFLRDSGLPAVSLHGDKCQEDREEALRLFRTGRHPILVATDVAARGLDIHNIQHVINCDLPSRIEDYVHRIGRTGRAGNKGRATSFVNEQNRPVLRDLLCLLEEAQQEVPPWFYELVKSCTSAYRGFGNGGHTHASSNTRLLGGGAGGAFPRSGSRTRFGGRDARGLPTGSSGGGGPAPPSSRSLLVSSASTKQSRFDDEEDGW